MKITIAILCTIVSILAMAFWMYWLAHSQAVGIVSMAIGGLFLAFMVFKLFYILLGGDK